MRPLLHALSMLAVASPLVGCPSDPPPEDPTFEVVFEGLPGALISVWGTSATDVWAVGGDGDGTGPMVVHFDGARWQRMATAQTGDLWWVHGTDDAVYMGGANGMMLRYASGAFERMTTPGSATVFGIWAASPTDVWAVGGTGTGGGGFAWRYDGTTWRDVPLPAEGVAASVFKVWGTGPDDVWLVGSMGLLLHWDGTAVTTVPSGTTRTIFTVHAIDGRAAAVGGFGSGVVLEREGAGAWQDVSPEGAVMMIGVWLTEDRGGWASGLNGAMMRCVRGDWEDFDTGIGVLGALHAVWVDPDGGIWAAGGQVLSAPLVDGVLIHAGADVPTTLEE